MSEITVQCPRVSGAIDNFGAAQPDKYRACPPLPFRRWWEGPDQMPAEAAVAYVGASDAGLCFYACLQDSDIFSRATGDNQRMWTLGDVAEFFVKPGRDRSDYWEIHVTPNDFIMDLYIPDREEFTSGATSFEEALAPSSESVKQVEVFSEQSKWAVEICIPWKAFGVEGVPAAGTVWQFAVCRYNCNGGLENPEHSSTAPLKEPGYHRHEEYCDLVF